VLYFEGERGHSFRILRAVKNRFGSTNEIGVFEMKEAGLAEVTNPSEIFLMERPLQVPGSAVVCSMEGTRPILVGIASAGEPIVSRRAAAHDHRRRSQPRRLLVAVLEKKMGAKLFDQDIFVNVAGGVHRRRAGRRLGNRLPLSRRAAGKKYLTRKRSSSAKSASPAKSAASPKPRRGSKKPAN
jgi:DNA repair protein RadA/Sms